MDMDDDLSVLAPVGGARPEIVSCHTPLSAVRLSGCRGLISLSVINSFIDLEQ